MKKLIIFLLVAVMCVSFCACKKTPTQPANQTPTVPLEADAVCSDQQIRLMMEKNLDCYFLFYVDPIQINGSIDSDKYGVADTSYLADYAALKNKVYDTYISSKAQDLLNYPDSITPLYKEKNGKLYVNPDAITKTQYDVIWDPDSYTVNILNNSTTACSFELITTYEGEDYIAEGSAKFENGKWLLTDIIY